VNSAAAGLPARDTRGVQIAIRRLVDADVDSVVDLSLAAWAPVFAGIEAELGPTLHRMLFPDWRSTQARAVEAVCRSLEHEVWVGAEGDRPVGFVAVRYVDEDAARAGEIDMVAVDPRCQRAGVGTALVRHAVDEIRAAGVDLAVLGTGGDAGHAPARALYESLGFRPYRHVRYYRLL
jgi:ribosomal protein S18 acetylase RimI-like enzyme